MINSSNHKTTNQFHEIDINTSVVNLRLKNHDDYDNIKHTHVYWISKEKEILEWNFELLQELFGEWHSLFYSQCSNKVHVA